MSHDHTHHSGDHTHEDTHMAQNQRRIFWVMCLTGSFMVAEIIGGLLSGSLALLADAGHMFTDTASLSLAWVAFKVSQRPADSTRSYGFHRTQVLAAFINGLAMFVLAAWIIVEAIDRMSHPIAILSGPMLVIAVLGLIVNVVAVALLHNGHGHENLNMQGAMLHVLGDLLGSVVAIIAALTIMTTGWTPIDPILSLFVAVLLLIGAWRIVRKSGHVLMEGTPPNIDLAQIRRHIMNTCPTVTDVHHLHVWSLTPERPLVTLHANVPEGTPHAQTLTQIHHELAQRFHLTHATVQLEEGSCPDECESIIPR